MGADELLVLSPPSVLTRLCLLSPTPLWHPMLGIYNDCALGLSRNPILGVLPLDSGCTGVIVLWWAQGQGGSHGPKPGYSGSLSSSFRTQTSKASERRGQAAVTGSSAPCPSRWRARLPCRSPPPPGLPGGHRRELARGGVSRRRPGRSARPGRPPRSATPAAAGQGRAGGGPYLARCPARLAGPGLRPLGSRRGSVPGGRTACGRASCSERSALPLT